MKQFDERQRETKPRQYLEPVEKLFKVLDQALQGVAIGIQCHPETSSLVVGGARLIINAALKFTTFFKRLTEMIDRLSDHLSHLQEFAHFSDELVILKVTSTIYGDLLKFYQQA